MRFIMNFLNSSSDIIFWISAIVGTTLFLLRMLMSFFGSGFFEENVDLDGFEDHNHHSGLLFKFFTMHSLSGFLMMFGWSGLACIAQFNLSTSYSFLIALICGISMILIIALIMHVAMFLESPGTIFSTKKTIGLIGKVYQYIPEHGQGKIHVVVNNITRELLAQSHNKKAIESFTLIKVVKIIDHEIVEVTEHI